MVVILKPEYICACIIRPWCPTTIKVGKHGEPERTRKIEVQKHAERSVNISVMFLKELPSIKKSTTKRLNRSIGCPLALRKLTIDEWRIILTDVRCNKINLEQLPEQEWKNLAERAKVIHESFILISLL